MPLIGCEAETRLCQVARPDFELGGEGFRPPLRGFGRCDDTLEAFFWDFGTDVENDASDGGLRKELPKNLSAKVTCGSSEEDISNLILLRTGYKAF